ncbi:unnamed protein product [Brachionus calyciflorus]|uniref:Uncharacterized protein n=1 Tax=Brachionus calyciflorus TaxID=104777 RepID=A0A814GJF2_9BILA|nr:unnamed protein product [Brachionus calyciflorus]
MDLSVRLKRYSQYIHDYYEKIRNILNDSFEIILANKELSEQQRNQINLKHDYIIYIMKEVKDLVLSNLDEYLNDFRDEDDIDTKNRKLFRNGFFCLIEQTKINQNQKFLLFVYWHRSFSQQAQHFLEYLKY